MINFISDALELRGIKNATSKKGNVYYTLNCEYPVDGTPIAFYVSDAQKIPSGVKKGDKVKVVVNYNRFKELVVKDVIKV